MDYDLQGARGPLEVAQFAQLKNLLLYSTADVMALHTVLQEAGRSADTVLAQAALAMNMYYAYQPLDDRLGSALLSRYPIQQASCVFDEKTKATMGMTVQLLVENRPYTILVVRPPTAAVARVAPETVQAQLKALGGSDYIVLASFGPGPGARARDLRLDKGRSLGPARVAEKLGHLPHRPPEGAAGFHPPFPQIATGVCEWRSAARRPLCWASASICPYRSPSGGSGPVGCFGT